MKVTINGFLLWEKESWSTNEGSFQFMPWEMKEHGCVTVMSHSFELDVGEFNPVPAQLDLLEKEKAKVRQESNRRIAQLNKQIGKLQALTFDEVKS